MLPEQIIALYLTRTTLEHEPKGRRASEIALAPGHVAICNRDDWETVHWKDPASFLCVRIADAALQEAAESFTASTISTGRARIELRSIHHAEDARMASLLYALEAERKREYPAGQLFLDSVEAAIATLLVTSHGRGKPKPEMKRGGLSPQRLRRVFEFMHGNIDQNVRLDDLAACAGLSSSHFSHQFNAATKASPYKYLRMLRIERGKELLKNPDLSVLEVALAVGFENQQHFATVFRRVVGASPSSYRRSL